ncbi:AAA family ATPase [Halobaculum litoreum]|uniref:AAA family ATPase n=1 Tax=Halobaculum litoreum TaxID=3031998 RepID=UPI0024C289D6|nr:AAA family ATPase [Halobaculum sp. DT92]
MSTSVPRVLELDRVPERMPHRDAALGQLANALDPLRSDRPAYPICISGPTGAGKTAVSRFAVRELRRETAVNTAHVDCLRTRSRAAILEEALVDAGLKTRSSPKADAASSYLAQMEDADSPIVLTLDEAEHIEDEHLPHVLFEADGVTPLFVVHEYERFAARLDAARRRDSAPARTSNSAGTVSRNSSTSSRRASTRATCPGSRTGRWSDRGHRRRQRS